MRLFDTILKSNQIRSTSYDIAEICQVSLRPRGQVHFPVFTTKIYVRNSDHLLIDFYDGRSCF